MFSESLVKTIREVVPDVDRQAIPLLQYLEVVKILDELFMLSPGLINEDYNAVESAKAAIKDAYENHGLPVTMFIAMKLGL